MRNATLPGVWIPTSSGARVNASCAIFLVSLAREGPQQIARSAGAGADLFKTLPCLAKSFGMVWRLGDRQNRFVSNSASFQ